MISESDPGVIKVGSSKQVAYRRLSERQVSLHGKVTLQGRNKDCDLAVLPDSEIKASGFKLLSNKPQKLWKRRYTLAGICFCYLVLSLFYHWLPCPILHLPDFSFTSPAHWLSVLCLVTFLFHLLLGSDAWNGCQVFWIPNQAHTASVKSIWLPSRPNVERLQVFLSSLI